MSPGKDGQGFLLGTCWECNCYYLRYINVHFGNMMLKYSLKWVHKFMRYAQYQC